MVGNGIDIHPRSNACKKDDVPLIEGMSLVILFENQIKQGGDRCHGAVTKFFDIHGEDVLWYGFFVEFGATNGIDFSNSYLLEKYFSWNGILAEPSKKWHKDLSWNRSVDIDYQCVWKETGEMLLFNETEIGEISTIDYFTNSDQFSEARRNGKRYEVNTISLVDLLDKYKAPKIIDYLSIDTEGSEWEILQVFDFDKYKFRVITCEHNYSSKRKLIHNLLSSHGYKRKYKKLSKFDDWYILED